MRRLHRQNFTNRIFRTLVELAYFNASF